LLPDPRSERSGLLHKILNGQLCLKIIFYRARLD
jgi:hypothetical protein